MPPREWTPVALLAQVMGYYHRHNGWPTVKELITHTGLTAEQAQTLLDVLLDRRLVKVDGETVYPWEAGPSPVVTYRLRRAHPAPAPDAGGGAVGVLRAAAGASGHRDLA